jgi:hypothetical protein
MLDNLINGVSDVVMPVANIMIVTIIISIIFIIASIDVSGTVIYDCI